MSIFGKKNKKSNLFHENLKMYFPRNNLKLDFKKRRTKKYANVIIEKIN